MRDPQTSHAPAPDSAPERARAEDHLSLVRRVAERMARRLPRGVDVRDLVSAGTLGLLDALEKYDPARCDRFSAYAEIRIRGAILDELRAMDWLPRSVREKGSRLQGAKSALRHALGRAPEDAEVAAYLGVTPDAHAAMQREVKTAQVVSAEEVSRQGVAALAREEQALPDKELFARELRERLATVIRRLPERERQVLSLYYVEDLKLKEIGEIFGVTESRICQIHAQAVRRLRKMLKSEEAAGARRAA